jgi:hypothetical protein
MIKNYHILKVTEVAPTFSRGTCIKVTSERFRQSRLIWYHADKPSLIESAIEWLRSNGFNVLGQGEGSNHMYIVVDDFEIDVFRELPKGNVKK